MKLYVIDLSEHKQKVVNLRKGQTYSLEKGYVIHKRFTEPNFEVLIIKRE